MKKDKNTREQCLLSDIRTIVDQGLQTAYQHVNTVVVRTYWQVGKRIVEEEQNGEKRAEYGKGLINFLSKELTAIYPKGYSPRDLRDYRQFYLSFKDLEIWYTRVPNLQKTSCGVKLNNRKKYFCRNMKTKQSKTINTA